MSRILVEQSKCKHSEGFFCTSVMAGDELIQHCFACTLVCGFWLNFNPESAGSLRNAVLPSRYTDDVWRISTMWFSPEPASREGGWKVSAPLSKYIA